MGWRRIALINTQDWTLYLNWTDKSVIQVKTKNCWFSHDVTKIQTEKLSILPRFYLHDALEQLKTNFHTNFRLKGVLGFVTEYA